MYDKNVLRHNTKKLTNLLLLCIYTVIEPVVGQYLKQIRRYCIMEQRLICAYSGKLISNLSKIGDFFLKQGLRSWLGLSHDTLKK